MRVPNGMPTICALMLAVSGAADAKRVSIRTQTMAMNGRISFRMNTFISCQLRFGFGPRGCTQIPKRFRSLLPGLDFECN
jgi:hypothetical protein